MKVTLKKEVVAVRYDGSNEEEIILLFTGWKSVDPKLVNKCHSLQGIMMKDTSGGKTYINKGDVVLCMEECGQRHIAVFGGEGARIFEDVVELTQADVERCKNGCPDGMDARNCKLFPSQCPMAKKNSDGSISFGRSKQLEMFNQ